MPYINFYFDNLSAEEHELHVLYWNRDLKAESLDEFKRVTIRRCKAFKDKKLSQIPKIRKETYPERKFRFHHLPALASRRSSFGSFKAPIQRPLHF